MTPALYWARGALRQVWAPSSIAVLVVSTVAAALLYVERQSSPVVRAGEASAPLGSLAGSLTVSAGILATWGGAAVVTTSTAYLVAADFESGAFDTFRSLGVPLRNRLIASLLSSLLVALATGFIMLGGLLAVGRLRGWTDYPTPSLGGPQATGPTDVLQLEPMMVARLLLALTFWWALASLLSIALQSPAYVAGGVAAATISALLLSSVGGLAPWLFTTWLGAAAGYAEGSSITNGWSNGSASSIQWSVGAHGMEALGAVTSLLVGAVAYVAHRLDSGLGLRRSSS